MKRLAYPYDIVGCASVAIVRCHIDDTVGCVIDDIVGCASVAIVRCHIDNTFGCVIGDIVSMCYCCHCWVSY